MSHQGTKTRRKDMGFEPLTQKEEGVARKLVDAAYVVHRTLGPGLFEKINVPIIKKGIKRIIL